jgi:hypothetical protein
MNQEIRSILDGVESAAGRLVWQEPRRPVTETDSRGTHDVRRRRSGLSLILLAVALAGAVVAVAWLLLRGDGSPSVPTADGVPALVAQTRLQRLAASLDHPVYWAGPRRGFRYELTTTTSGRIFVRYLPDGVAAGDPRPEFLTVGTYPGARSFADLKRAANREGATWVGLDDGELVVVAAGDSHRAYLGHERENDQVEVFAPSSDTARKLVLSGAIVPVS